MVSKFLIVGLGNPGEDRIHNRQNIGFKVVDVLANDSEITVNKIKKKCFFGIGQIEGSDVVIIKPQTFNNLVGESVINLASYHRIQPSSIIVVTDDIELPLGRIVVQKGGADHNSGILSVRVAVRTADFIRVRTGIRGEGSINLPHYLMSDFEPIENLYLISIISEATNAIRKILKSGIEEAADVFSL